MKNIHDICGKTQSISLFRENKKIDYVHGNRPQIKNWDRFLKKKFFHVPQVKSFDSKEYKKWQERIENKESCFDIFGT